MAFTLGSSETAAKDGSTPDYLQSPLSSGCHPVSLLNELRAWSSRRCPLVKLLTYSRHIPSSSITIEVFWRVYS
ncbi:hypothetical protein PGTUg99_030520 [Puccinia graminis f. sp. tritici]|uniref:Uncharacterized protein n=1 Tax=Puccinia graminis f. sp. tritici TaxID=56615 RepID=A0A5B0RUQ1_PUCGR|nr:hypothetical protein PGTUg99_030520 [Puccinia graminis f. sp. tritici]